MNGISNVIHHYCSQRFMQLVTKKEQI